MDKSETIENTYRILQAVRDVTTVFDIYTAVEEGANFSCMQVDSLAVLFESAGNHGVALGWIRSHIDGDNETDDDHAGVNPEEYLTELTT